MRISLAVLVGALAACGDNQDPVGAAALWEDIHRDEYRTWQRAPGYEQRRRSNAPHGDDVIVFVDDVVVEALSAESPVSEWPLGSTIVKDGYNGSALELVAVMEKRESGWFWAEYDGDGEASYSGSPDLCTGCHRSGDDYVRAFTFAGSMVE